MICEYGYYKDEETYYPKLYCGINNKFCIYTKKCEREHKFIPTNQDECYIRNEHDRNSIPKGSCYVRTQDKGYLYVEIDNDHVKKIKNTLGNVKDYVFLKQVGQTYEISLSPFEDN